MFSEIRLYLRDCVPRRVCYTVVKRFEIINVTATQVYTYSGSQSEFLGHRAAWFPQWSLHVLSASWHIL